MKFRWLKSFAIVVLTALALYIGLCILGAAATMEQPRLPLTSSTLASIGVTYESVVFLSRDHTVTLRGWYMNSSGENVIIVVNGGFQNRIDETVGTLQISRDLVLKGYSILLFDQRGRGESTGKGLSLSYMDADIGGAVDYLKNRGYSPAKIGIIGFCSGAAESSIYASQEKIGGLVLDGCFPSVTGMLLSQAVGRGIPRPIVNVFIEGLLMATKLFYGYELVDPIDAIPSITCPIFFIHEEYDSFVSLDETYQLMEASQNPLNEFWQVANAEHSQAYNTCPPEYIEKLHGFFNSVMK